MPEVKIEEAVTLPMLSVALPRGCNGVTPEILRDILRQLVGTQPVLPQAPRFGRAGVCTLMQDAPDHWLVRYDAGVLPAGVESADTVTVTDVSDGWQTFCIRGEGARDLLAKGTRVDVHSDAALPGFFRTTLAEVPVILLVHECDCEVMVPRSHAAWVHAWLHHAADQAD